MQDTEFPIFKTKIQGLDKKFDLTDGQQRKEYFGLKVGDEIKRLQQYLANGNTFIAYLLGKKNSGKGTYAKMLQEIVAPDKIDHLSIGDLVRTLDEVMADKAKKETFIKEITKLYRGYMPLGDIIKSLEERSTKTLLPTELILALVKMKIFQEGKKALFIDGFPRALDQISYSLFFRDLIGYRDDPDVFVLIDVPESVIDERIKYRQVCPTCQTSRNLKLLPTKEVEYDEKTKQFYLRCDNSACSGDRLAPKEGDELGIEPIRERLKVDEQLIKQAFDLHGIPKILLRNSVPVDKANALVDDYEITPEFSFKKEGNQVKTMASPWQIKDDQGTMSYSLMPPAVVVSLIKQLVGALGI